MENNNNFDGFGSSEVDARISEIISSMSEAEKRELLKRLEQWRQSKIAEKRKHPRKRVFNYIECVGQFCAFTDFIQNISAGGLFIETKFPVFIDQELSLIFSLPSTEDTIKIAGKVVRVDKKGFAVQFDETIQGV